MSKWPIIKHFLFNWIIFYPLIWSFIIIFIYSFKTNYIHIHHINYLSYKIHITPSQNNITYKFTLIFIIIIYSKSTHPSQDSCRWGFYPQTHYQLDAQKARTYLESSPKVKDKQPPHEWMDASIQPTVGFMPYKELPSPKLDWSRLTS